MITFSDSQTAILAKSHHKITYLFETSGLYLSHKSHTYNGQDYDAKVPLDSFSGIVLNAAKSEHNIQAPNDFSFTVANKDNELSVSDFKTGGVFNPVTVRLLINNVQFRVFKFRITGIDDIQQRLHIRAEDYLKKFLEGEWPNTVQVNTLAPDDTFLPKDNLCLPVPFGTCYIPLRSIYTDSDRFVVLGPADGLTYTISEVTSPHDWPLKSVWTSGSFTFEQSTKAIDGVNYRCFRPLVASGGANGVWKPGSYYLDPLVKFSRSDLSSLTDFSDVLSYILQDFGIPASMIDASSFASAKSTYTSWGLTFNYGFFFPQPRGQVISSILNACNSTLVFNEKIELKVLARTVRATIDQDDVYNDDGSSFVTVGTVSESDYDAANIAFQESNKPQDNLAKCVVVADGGSSYDSLSQEVLQIPYIQNSVHAQRAGELWAERKFTGSQKFSFTGKRTLLALEPNDTIQVSHTRYGGSYKAVIDSITFLARPIFSIVKYSSDLTEWGDNTPNSVTIAADGTANPWSMVTVGPDSSPDSGYVPNILRGRLRIGTGADCIIIDPDTYSITVVESGNDFLTIGLVDTDDYGIQGNDASGNKLFKVSTSGAEIGGWTIEENKISITGLELDAANNRFRAFTGSNYVDVTAAGLIGYDSVLGQTFKLLTDGSAPEFSSGVIKECVYEIYTSGVIRTDADPASNGGLLINNTEIKGYNSSGSLTFQVIYDGTDQGDFLLGGDPASAHGISYDHSAGTMAMRGALTITGGSGIANLTDAGGLATADEVEWADVADGATTKPSNNADVTQAALISGTTITGGGVILNGGGSIRTTGKTAYDNDAQVGVYLGYDGEYCIGITDGTSHFEFGTSTGLDIQVGSGDQIGIDGSLNMGAGSDIHMTAQTGGAASDRAIIDFVVDNSRTISMAADFDDERLSIYPLTDTYCHFSIGYDESGTEKKFDDIYIAASDYVQLMAKYATSNRVLSYLSSTSSGSYWYCMAEADANHAGNIYLGTGTTYDANVVGMMVEDSGYTARVTAKFLNTDEPRIEIEGDTVDMDQNSATTNVLQFRNGTVAHGRTNYDVTNLFGKFIINDDTSGGLAIWGYNDDTTAKPGMHLVGIKESTDHSEYGVVEVNGLEAHATIPGGLQYLAGSDRFFVVRNFLTAIWYVSADGHTFGKYAGSTFDDEDDAQLAKDMSYIIANEPGLATQYSRDQVKALGFIQEEKNQETGQDEFFVNHSQVSMLQLGAVGELYDVVQELAKRLGTDYKTIKDQVRPGQGVRP